MADVLMRTAMYLLLVACSKQTAAPPARAFNECSASVTYWGANEAPKGAIGFSGVTALTGAFVGPGAISTRPGNYGNPALICDNFGNCIVNGAQGLSP